MAFNFDGPNKLIYLTPGTIEFDAVDLYSVWKRWVREGDNLKYIDAMKSIGGEEIAPGKYISTSKSQSLETGDGNCDVGFGFI